MQQAGNAALAAEVDSDVRDVIYKLEVDWNKNGLYNHALSDLTEVVKSIQIKRDVTGTLPIETTMVEGFMAASVSVRLGGTRSGDVLSIAQQLSPWRTDSVLYGQSRTTYPIRVYIGHRVADGTEVQIQQVQGVIDDCKVTSSNREVSLSLLDPSVNLKAEIDLPQMAMPPGSSNQPAAGLWLTNNSQWIIDYVFRRNGVYMTPPNHAKDFFVATLHGSPAPELGHQPFYWTGNGTVTEDTQIHWPARAGWGLAWGGSTAWWQLVSYRGHSTSFTATASQTLVIQFQADLSKAPLQHPQSEGTLAIYCSGNGFLVGNAFRVRTDTVGRLFLDCYKDAVLITTLGGPTLGTAGWTDCWVEIELGSGTMSASTLRWPGLTSAVSLAGMDTTPTLSLYPTIYVGAAVPMSDLHMTNRTGLSAGTTRYDPTTWVPQASIDAGLNEMTGIPLERGVDSWDLLKRVAQAEYGIVGYDEAGFPAFRNRDTLRRQNLTIEKTADDTKVLTELGLSEKAGSVRNRVTTQAAQRRFTGPTDSTKAWRTVYSLENSQDILLTPGLTILDLQMNSPWAYVDPYVAVIQYTTAQWDGFNTETVHGFVTTNLSNGAVNTGVDCTVVPLSPLVGPDMVRVIFDNSNGTHLRLQTTDGSAAFKLRGRKYEDKDPVSLSFKRNSSILKYGEQILDLPASPYRQTYRSVQTIAISLLKDLAKPVPVVDQITAVGDCRTQLADSIQIEDEGGLGGPVYTSLVGLTRSLDISDKGAKLTDQMNVRPFSAPGKWILGHPTRSVLGSTTIL